MSAPARDSKRSSSIRKATALVHPTPRRKEDPMGQTERGGGAEGATPNRKRQQQQDVHRDSKNDLHKAEGDRKHDGQSQRSLRR